MIIPVFFVTACVAAAVIAKSKESYTDSGSYGSYQSYVPWILVAAALVVTTMTVNAMSPVINVVIAAAILWYIYKVPTVKTMTQNAMKELTAMIPAATPLAPVATPLVPAALVPAAPAPE